MLLSLLTAFSVSAVSFTASLDADTITLGESVTLTLTFTGGSPRALPALPNGPNLQISGHGTSQQFSIENGVASSSVSHTFTLTPSKAGEYNIPALTANIDGKNYSSQPLKLTVLKPDAGQNAAGDSGELALLRLLVPKKELYVGEVIQAELRLLLRDGVANIENFQLPPMQGEGFTAGRMVKGNVRHTVMGGVGYNVIPLSLTFTAVKAGTLALGPAECSVTLLLPPVDFFGRPSRRLPVQLKSDSVTVQSLPLPRENVPPSFSGAVGDLTMAVSVSPTNIAVGDPITISVDISGRGNVDSITLPAQTNWTQFKAYPPTSDFQPSDESGVNGTRQFKLTVVPQSTDIHTLPPFEFSYFDATQKAYKTLVYPAVPLIVRPSAASLPPSSLTRSGSESNNPKPSSDIIHIKARLGTVAQIQPPLIQLPWFISLQAVPVVAWLALMLARKRREQLANNPRLRRSREAEKVIRRGLHELRHAAQKNQREAFFAALFRLLQEQLGERLDLPASAITEAVVEERLAASHLSETTKGSLRELFFLCNQARYAGQNTSQELAALVPKVEQTLRELKNIEA